MHRLFGFLATAALALTVAIALTGCGRGSTGTRTPDGRVRVAASIFPLADILSRVGGDRVDTIVLLPPGESPHHYEPTPAQVEELTRSALLVVVGLGVDDWARRSNAAAGEEHKVVVLADLFTEEELSVGESAACEGGHDHAGDHAHAHDGPGDPHLWLDPVKMLRAVDAIAQALSEVDAGGADAFAANAEACKKQLQDLDRHCRQQTAALPRKEFVTFHAAYGHFAKRYGLKQVALRWVDASEPSPQQIEKVVRFIEGNKIKTMFAEPQFPVDQLDAIAEQTGVEVDRLDPLGAPGVIGHDSYVELMKTNLATLVQGLSN